MNEARASRIFKKVRPCGIKSHYKHVIVRTLYPVQSQPIKEGKRIKESRSDGETLRSK